MKIRMAIMTAIVSLGFLGTAGTCVADGCPLPKRTFLLHVAQTGPGTEKVLLQILPLIQEARRQFTDSKEIQRSGAGKVTDVEVTHELDPTVTIAKWHFQDVHETLFSNVFTEAWQVVRFQKMAKHALLDVEIIQQTNLGEVTGLRLYFADP